MTAVLLNDYGVSNKLSIVRRKVLALGYRRYMAIEASSTLRRVVPFAFDTLGACLEKSLVVDYRAQ
ncbi:hypothetical protein AB4Z32_25100 [Massilia sp. 2TAF26]|uniref:hypothetical protein n=1 Tax=Massilia sp. 2TAF26 TaxID=3233012 RepID=UPI003F973476